MIRTKLNLPVPHMQSIERKTVFAALDQGLISRLTLIVAGAGYGKSTVAGAWLEKVRAEGVRIAWVSLDAADNDPHRLMLYIITALNNQCGGGFEEVIEQLVSPFPPQMEWVLDESIHILETLYSNQKVILALDDFHLIQSSSVIQVIDFLIKNCPRALKLMLISRESPELPLAVYRSKNWLTEIDVKILALNRFESESFLKKAMGLETLTVSEETLSALIQQTEGWAVGLQLAALTIKSRGAFPAETFKSGESEEAALLKSIEAFSGSHPYVMSYMTDQVLNNLTESERLLLLCASVTERFNAELLEVLLRSLEEVLGTETLGLSSEASSMLVQLERRHYFLLPLDEERKWYRFHHLFSEVLREQLKQWLKKPNIKERGITLEKLHLVASQWFTENHFEIEGFQHATLSGEIDLAAKLLQNGPVPLLYRGATVMALEWLESLPQSELNTRPWLWMMLASADFYLGRMAEVTLRLKAAERSIDQLEKDQQVDFSKIRGHIASIRSVLFATLHDFKQAEAQATLALSLSDEENITVRCSALWALGYAKLSTNHFEQALEYLSEAKMMSKRSGPTIIWLMSTIGMGNIKKNALSYDSALNDYQEVFDYKGHKGYPVTCDAYLAKAAIRMSQGQLNEAEQLIQEAKKLVALIDHTDRKALCQMAEAKLLTAKGAFRAALMMLEQVEKYCKSEGFKHRLDEVAFEQGLVLLKLGNLGAVEILLKLKYLERLDMRLKLAKGEGRSAIGLLEPLIEKAKSEGLHEQMLEDLVLHAYACYKYGAQQKGLESLQQAVMLCHQNQCTLPFVEAGPMMAAIIQASELEQVYPEFMKQVLEAISSAEKVETVPVLDPLTPREMEVLRLIAEGLSNEEIGSQLYLALSSVKGINQRIFNKLQVDRRTEAVAKAKQLGWFV